MMGHCTFSSLEALFSILCWSQRAALHVRNAGVYVTVYLGSVFRAVLTVTLSGLIWALDIALFYSPLGHGVFGEPLDPQVTPSRHNCS